MGVTNGLESNYCLQLIELKKLDDFRWRVALGNPTKALRECEPFLPE
jgi:hypothetical protein